MNEVESSQKPLFPGYKAQLFRVQEDENPETVNLTLNREGRFTMIDRDCKEVFNVDFMDAEPVFSPGNVSLELIIDEKKYVILNIPQKNDYDNSTEWEMYPSDELYDDYWDHSKQWSKYMDYVRAFNQKPNELAEEFANSVQDGTVGWHLIFADKEKTMATLKDDLGYLNADSPLNTKKMRHPGFKQQVCLISLMRGGLLPVPVNLTLTPDGKFSMMTKRGKEKFKVHLKEIEFTFDEKKDRIRLVVEGKKYAFCNREQFKLIKPGLDLDEDYSDYRWEEVYEYDKYRLRIGEKEKILDEFLRKNDFHGDEYSPLCWKHIFENRDRVLELFK